MLHGTVFSKVGGAHTPFTVSQMSFFRSTISKKIVFFAFFYRILIKSAPLAAGGKYVKKKFHFFRLFC
jgi:hypothetical protein